MAWATQSTKATGDLVTAANWNAAAVNNVNYLKGQAGTIEFEAGATFDGAVTLNNLLTTDGFAGQISLLTSASSPYAVLADDYYIEADCSGGTIEVNLPAAVDGRILIILKTDASTILVVNINRNGSEAIQGGTICVLDAQWEGVVLAGKVTTGWRIIAQMGTPAVS